MTCLGSVYSLDMVSRLAIIPQIGNTDSEIVIQSVGGIRCVDSVFLTFADRKANAMTQGKQLQCSKFFFFQALSSRFVFYVETQDMLQEKETPGTYFTTPVRSRKISANPGLQVSMANVQKLAEYLTDFARGNSS